MFCRFQIFIHLLEVHEAVANTDNAADSGKLRLLANKELFNRVIVNQPDVGVSIKIPHGFSAITNGGQPIRAVLNVTCAWHGVNYILFCE